ncbi:MAG: hypothetical protein JSV05_09645 [Candidatus Bathyarchaeota archaeon]|nr:MAG: hypothetical protein JSV05_09645 [Candidatus Bathyarchaeota archaeon]
MQVRLDYDCKQLDIYFIVLITHTLSIMITSLNGVGILSVFVWLIVGVFLGIIFDFLWWRTGISKYERRIELFEHYHWGMVLLILVKIFLASSEIFFAFAGTGISLILAEVTQEHPFAIRSSHPLSSTLIGAILFILAVFV